MEERGQPDSPDPDDPMDNPFAIPRATEPGREKPSTVPETSARTTSGTWVLASGGITACGWNMAWKFGDVCLIVDVRLFPTSPGLSSNQCSGFELQIAVQICSAQSYQDRAQTF